MNWPAFGGRSAATLPPVPVAVSCRPVPFSRYDRAVTTLLAVVPHPDDESYSFGGTIALAAKAGWTIAIHCASSGEQGERHDGGAAEPAILGPHREQELYASGRLLGIGSYSFWRFPDGQVAPGLQDVARLAAVIRGERPRIVMALGRDGAYGHPDHLAVYRWVRDAWDSLGDSRPALLLAAFPAGLFLPQYAKCVEGGIMGDPPAVKPGDIGSQDWHYEVPIARVANLKREAIAAHRSQLPNADPDALFPPGIVAALMETERFVDARGTRDEATARLLRSLR